MCYHRVAVIVIVISTDDSGEGLLKHINVGDKSTMVARLPQQVFLLLALVTGTTMGLGTHGGELPKSTSSSRPPSEDETSGGRASDEMLRKTIDPLDEASNSVHRPPPAADDSSSVRTKSLESETRAENTWTRYVVDEFTSPSPDPTAEGDESQSIASSRTEGFGRQSQSEETRETYAPTVRGTPDEPPSFPVPSTPGYFVLSTSSSRPSSALSTTSSMISRSVPPTSSSASRRSSNSAVSFAAADGLYTKATVPTLASSGNTRGNADRRIVKLDESFSDEAPTGERGNNKNSETDVERLEPKLTRVAHDLRAETSRILATAKTLASSSDVRDEPDRRATKSRENFSNEAETREETDGKIDTESVEPKSTRLTHDFRAETTKKLVTTETSSTTRNPVKEANVTASTWRSHRGDQRETGRSVWLTGSRALQPATTLTPGAGLSYPRRYTRDAAENNYCEKFEIGDPEKREFYSPNYPQNYPPLMDCVLVLEAEKGMLLKLDFREQFELEMKTPEGECRFDYLEVRDGQYGFSPRKGIYCDKEFPPEIHSQGRYLWLNFHSDDTIEYRGFKAVWSTVPRPKTAYPPEQEPCIYHKDIPADFELKSEMIKDAKKLAESNSVALDCLWVLQAPAEMKMQLTFDSFKLDKPNDCSANFLDIFDGQTDEPSRVKKFCGSIAESLSTRSNMLYIRLYLELKAINSSFSALITAVRDKESNQDCKEGEFDCQDATCIDKSLKCNKRRNCRFQRDEDDTQCGTSFEKQDRSRIVIILVIFSLIMFGMCSAFVFNCVRKLRRDHRIIREHIRQSREDRLDEIGRRATPCPLSVSRTDLRDGGSESPPGEEVDSSKELIPSAALSAREYTKELALQMKYGNKEITDIHQSNNVSNATQERLQESSEEPDMCDSSCQTRESLFAPTIPDAILSSPGFSTFGYRNVAGPESGGSHKGTPTSERSYRHHRHQHPPPLRQSQRPSQESNRSNSQLSSHPDRCSHEGCAQICPKHNPIPAPPGWSLHDPPYPQILPDSSVCPAPGENSTYRRYQSPKPEHETVAPGVYQHQPQQQPPPPPQHQHQQQYPYPHFTRQNTVGSGERYGSFIYGSGRASSDAPSSNATTTTAPSNATGSGSPHSSATPAKHRDPRYRAEAVIEVDQKRPFSIESTKSAPDVIATH